MAELSFGTTSQPLKPATRFREQPEFDTLRGSKLSEEVEHSITRSTSTYSDDYPLDSALRNLVCLSRSTAPKLLNSSLVQSTKGSKDTKKLLDA